MQFSSFLRMAAVLACAAVAVSATAQQRPAPIKMDPTHAKVACAKCHAETPPSKAPGMDACFKCHGSYAEVAADTAKLKVNPHDSHKGQPECRSCHSMHGQSVLSCNDCHSFSGMKLK